MPRKWPIHPWFLVPQILLLGLILVLSFHIFFLNKTYSGLKVAGISVSGQKQDQVLSKLNSLQKPGTFDLVYEGKEFTIHTEDFNVLYDTESSANNALAYGKNKSLIPSLKHKLEAAKGNVNLPLLYTFEEDKLNELIDLVSAQVSLPPVEPSVSIDKGVVLVDAGKRGTVVDTEKLKSSVLGALSYPSTNPIAIPITNVNPELTGEQVEMLKKKAESLVGKQLQVTFEYQSFTYKDKDLVALLTPSGADDSKLNVLIDEISSAVGRPPQNARFVFEEGKVKEFTPAKKGISVKKDELKTGFIQNLEILSGSDKKMASFPLSVVSTDPQVGNEEVNTLGIKELIGRGTSLYHGSIPGRIHNVALATSRINGLLIKPGATFSFNDALGDVSADTGYQQAYVIKQGRTVLGDGGGVCQVSTTFFRAALNAGLPILERKAHAYRVHYYEEDVLPGIDATVFAPSADLKIQNNTPATILVQAKADTKNMSLVFEFYGTSDGRVAEISNHKIWGVTPAPATAYQDDPTLPLGKKKQVDWSAPGTKASFDYKVTRGGEVLENKTFYSNYRPWQAVFLVGTGPAE